MRLLPLLAAMLLCAAAGPASRPADALRLKADAPDDVKKWWNDQPRLRKEHKPDLAKQLATARAKLSILRNSRYGAGRPFATHEEKDQAIKIQQTRVTELESDLRDIDSLIIYEEDAHPTPGVITKLTSVLVKQVISPTEAIVETRPTGVYLSGSTVWLSGVDMPNATDDHTFKFDVPMAIRVVGTKQYDTANGSTRTVLLANGFNASTYLENALSR